jgi:hypothetical protein
MTTYFFITGVAAFFGGWCGTVPISIVTWWILHRQNQIPASDPWFKISFVGSLAGLMLGTTVSSSVYEGIICMNAVLLSGIVGVVVGLVVGSIVGKAALPSLKQGAF